MKKTLFASIALAALTLVSCEKEKVGGTAVESMSGEWYVISQGIDEYGNVLYDDPFDLGPFIVLTYNDAANSPDKLFVQDTPNDTGYPLWDFKVKTDCNPEAGTFGIIGGEDYQWGISVDIAGKILKGAATTPSGMSADSIVIDILFEDDDNAIPNVGEELGYYDRLRITGYRYTGLAADE